MVHASIDVLKPIPHHVMVDSDVYSYRNTELLYILNDILDLIQCCKVVSWGYFVVQDEMEELSMLLSRIRIPLSLSLSLTETAL